MDKRDVISCEKLIEIICDCEDMGVKAVTFSGGGEPLLYPNFVDIITWFKTVKLAVITNGIMLKGELALALAKKATWIRISVDGWDSESYAFYRECSKDDYGKLVQNIIDFKKLKSKCVLGINIVISTLNIGHIYEMVSFWHDLGIDNIKLSPAIMSNNSVDNYMMHKPILEIFEAELARITKAGILIYNSYYFQLEGFEKDYEWCPYIQILPIIGADLNVYCCHDKAYNKDTGMLGSIKDISFKEFWFADKDKFFKINPQRDCKHHCVTDRTNKMIFDYLTVEHREFV
jgi:MoaA/NifB/PqqE/SkfB family radical SAM enzyme